MKLAKRHSKRKKPGLHPRETRLAKLRENSQALFLAAGFLAVWSGLLWLWEHGRREQQASWPVAEATVVGRELDRSGKRDNSMLVVRYLVHNRTHEAALFWDTNDFDETHRAVISASAPAIGTQLKVHYDPTNPAVAAVDHVPKDADSAPFAYAMTSGTALVWAALTRLRWHAARRAKRP